MVNVVPLNLSACNGSVWFSNPVLILLLFWQSRELGQFWQAGFGDMSVISIIFVTFGPRAQLLKIICLTNYDAKIQLQMSIYSKTVWNIVNRLTTSVSSTKCAVPVSGCKPVSTSTVTTPPRRRGAPASGSKLDSINYELTLQWDYRVPAVTLSLDLKYHIATLDHF